MNICCIYKFNQIIIKDIFQLSFLLFIVFLSSRLLGLFRRVDSPFLKNGKILILPSFHSFWTFPQSRKIELMSSLLQLFRHIEIQGKIAKEDAIFKRRQVASIGPNVCLSVNQSVCLSVCLTV